MADDPLSRVFAALADPTRRAILARLRGGEVTVTELTASFPISQPAVSKHLKVLEEAGLVTRSRRATARLSHLEAGAMGDAAAWLEPFRAAWQDRHDRLADLLAGMARDGTDTTHGTDSTHSTHSTHGTTDTGGPS